MFSANIMSQSAPPCAVLFHVLQTDSIRFHKVKVNEHSSVRRDYNGGNSISGLLEEVNSIARMDNGHKVESRSNAVCFLSWQSLGSELLGSQLLAVCTTDWWWTECNISMLIDVIQLSSEEGAACSQSESEREREREGHSQSVVVNMADGAQCRQAQGYPHRCKVWKIWIFLEGEWLVHVGIQRDLKDLTDESKRRAGAYLH